MSTVDYLRRQARELRAMIEDYPEMREELEQLAEQCEKLANEMTGNGHDAAPDTDERAG